MEKMRQKAHLLVELSGDQIRKRASKAVTRTTLVAIIILTQIVMAFAPPALAMPGASQMHQFTQQKSAKKKKEPEDKGPMRACLVASIYVPHNNNAIDNFVAYPYPFPPIEISSFKTDLPTDPIKVKSLLKDELTAKNWVIDEAFFKQGYFTQDAFTAALADCKLPTSGKFDPAWLDQVAEAFQSHLVLTNKREELRKQQYKVLVAYASEEGDKLKAKSELEKLCPIRIPVMQLRHGLWQGCNWLGEGTWWVVGTHRVPNLLYYWQVKISVPLDPTSETGEAQYLQLTDQNAAAIEENR